MQERGYTVFVIDHRFAPMFRSTDIIADARRAVRYVRRHARDHGIRPDHIGAIGHSSGGNLAALLGTSDTVIAEPGSAIDSASSRVQAVLTMAAPFDLLMIDTALTGGTGAWMRDVLTAYIGAPPEDSTMAQAYRAASPIHHVDAEDAPFLLHYSTDDPIVPVSQALAMHAALQAAGVPSTLVPSDHAEHMPAVDIDAVDAWFRAQLAVGP